MLVLTFSKAHSEPFTGLFCKSEAAMVEVMVAYQKGGYDLEDVVASALVEKGECMRIPDDMPIDLVVVMEGRVIGKHRLYGLARDEQSDIELYGQAYYDDHSI